MFLVRTLHKWFGLILGLQFLLWSVSGAMMALLDHHKVSGETSVRERAPVVLPAEAASLSQIAGALDQPVLKLRIKTLGAAPVYEATTVQGVTLLDAVTAAPVTVDAAKAGRLAAAVFKGPEGVASIRKVETANLETRKLALPAWRVEFADDQHTTLFVSARTGEVLGLRNDTWRLWDVFWMIHIMDYTERESFNHPLIVTVATGVAWLALSGLILLFRAFRCSDFAWIVDPWERLRRR
jgi:uncharacterized iron-regulated membrane protein